MIAFFCVYAVLAADSGLEYHARLQAKGLRVAALAYATCPANETNSYPATLADLVRPPFGGTAYVKDPKTAFHDPWGKLFYTAVELDEKGDTRFCVWTEREVNGKVKRIGYPPKGKK
jgi:hypothetical protein